MSDTSDEKRFQAAPVGGTDGHVVVGVFDGDLQIGEYVRNYHGFARSTFFAFEQAGQWFAVYSKDYTCLRLMSLPDCRDIGGEDRDAHGFCPVEILVPELCGQALDPADPAPRVANHDPDKWATKVPTANGTRYYWPDDKGGPAYSSAREAEYLVEHAKSHAAAEQWLERNPYVTRYATWGLVAGCRWGDDTSWKVQFLDLSRVSEGILARDDRFGYLELPRGVSLVDAVYTDEIEDLNAPFDKQHITIAVPRRFTLAGKLLED